MLDTTTLIYSVSALVQPWADLYADNTTLSTGVLAAHILAMFVGGGMAISADRTILRSKPGTADAVRAVVADLSTTHSIVIGSLTVTVLTGLALLASDVGNFAVSRVFWVKMGSFAILLVKWRGIEHQYEVIRALEADGCVVFNPHVVTIEDGGMKQIDSAQIDFKRQADPMGLMNPGKTRGWAPEMARDE